MTMFQKAQKSMSKLRVGLCGPAGSGKSYSALMLAAGIQSRTGDRIAAIDTERGSLSLYADLVDFDVVELKPPYDPRAYVDMIMMAERAGYGIIIIDSITHEWSGEGGVLELVEKMPGQNSFQKWGQATPLHQKFVDSMLKSNCHVIATMRSKTEYVETEKNGKRNFAKAGSGPQQREGIDYEFSIILDIEREKHIASANKDRTRLWDTRYETVTPHHGVELVEWLNVGKSEERRVKSEINNSQTNSASNSPTPTPSPVERGAVETQNIASVQSDGALERGEAMRQPSAVAQDIEQPRPQELPDVKVISGEITKLSRQLFANKNEYLQWIESAFNMKYEQMNVNHLPDIFNRLQQYAQILATAGK